MSTCPGWMAETSIIQGTLWSNGGLSTCCIQLTSARLSLPKYLSRLTCMATTCHIRMDRSILRVVWMCIGLWFLLALAGRSALNPSSRPITRQETHLSLTVKVGQFLLMVTVMLIRFQISQQPRLQATSHFSITTFTAQVMGQCVTGLRFLWPPPTQRLDQRMSHRPRTC